ncbi:hypothetical protein BGY98DRAFT_128607 [Russula aff. rugulosa BPL654]|nr:hypothetical protein BGY98DRAFT_128607 [Russula aff. rugulosa BPL654]
MDARGQFWETCRRSPSWLCCQRLIMRVGSMDRIKTRTERPAGASNAGILLPSSSLQTNFLISNYSKAGVQVPRVYAAFLREDTSVWTTGYIVMQYIDAPDCGERDHQLVRVVQTLISVKGPSSVRSASGLGPERNGLPRRSARRHVLLLIFLFSFSSRCSYRLALDTRHNVATMRQLYAPFSSHLDLPLCSHLRGRRH